MDLRTADRAALRLVWVPGEELDALGVLPETLDVRPIPKAPGGDPGLADVEFVAMPMRTPSGDPTSLFAGLWERMTSLRYVQVPSAGVDWIIGDIPPGVAVCSARGVHDIPVSEWVLAAVLAGFKDLDRFRNDMHEGRWASEDLPELSGANVLLLGYGSIAHAVERRLEPFEPKSIVRLARHAREGVLTMDALPGVLPAADVVIVLLPLTAETRGLVGTDFLAAMKPGALLVNAARGKIVDTAALLEALRTGRIRAVLDVTDPEPLPADHPLWRAPGLLVTPHIAGASERLAARITAFVHAQLERLARDEPLENVVREGY